MKVKIGSTNEGKITAANAYLAYQAGAYPGSPVMGGTQNVFTPYDLENARAEGLDVITNMPKVLAYRAPGVGGAGFAVEQVMDQICEKLGMDPIEFRILNGAKEGTRRITGPQLPKTGYPEILQTAKEHDHYKTPLTGHNQGRGVAVGFWGNTTGPASAVASVNLRRHREPGGRVRGHWRHQGCGGHARCGGIGYRSRRRQTLRRGHGLHWIHQNHRRQARLPS